MTETHHPPSLSLSELPDDELSGYAADLGLDLPVQVGRGELLRRIRERQELLIELDREAMLEVVVWARRPVRRSASKEALAKEIAQIDRTDFENLGDQGLATLARLRGLTLRDGEHRAELETRLKKAAGLGAKLRRARRRIVAGLIAKAVKTESAGQYQFLPEHTPDSLKKRIEQEGVVGGIASKLRGVADDYVREKLDEIEARIDRKLDEIDQRLAEWRDREVANRLKILKITLLVSILVALVSLGYDVLTVEPDSEPPHVSSVAPDESGPTTGEVTNGQAVEGNGHDNVREVQSPGRQGR